MVISVASGLSKEIYSGVSLQQIPGDTENSSLYQKFTITSSSIIGEHVLGHMRLFTVTEIHCKSVLHNEFQLYYHC